MIRLNFFYASFVPSENTSWHFPTEILRYFFLKIRKCWILFLQNIFLHFFGKLLVWTGRMQLWWLTEVSWLNPVNHQLKVRNWWKKILGWNHFFRLKTFETVEGSFGNPAIDFFVKSLRSYCSQSKKSDECSKKSFSKLLSPWDFGFRWDNPTERFSAKKPLLL